MKLVGMFDAVAYELAENISVTYIAGVAGLAR
jgi:hypothetical protein